MHRRFSWKVPVSPQAAGSPLEESPSSSRYGAPKKPNMSRHMARRAGPTEEKFGALDFLGRTESCSVALTATISDTMVQNTCSVLHRPDPGRASALSSQLS